MQKKERRGRRIVAAKRGLRGDQKQWAGRRREVAAWDEAGRVGRRRSQFVLKGAKFRRLTEQAPADGDQAIDHLGRELELDGLLEVVAFHWVGELGEVHADEVDLWYPTLWCGAALPDFKALAHKIDEEGVGAIDGALAECGDHIG
ncbi:MAG: hypothetical protein IPL39_17425 [Opitutaceae bacterium]|nr:hypothetical protein [Opitutaceae bacterium]